MAALTCAARQPRNPDMRQIRTGYPTCRPRGLRQFPSGAECSRRRESARAPRRARDLPIIWIWGPPESGKSHLLQASVAPAHGRGAATAYLPLGEPHGHVTRRARRAWRHSTCWRSMTLRAVAGDAGWERALFRLYEGLVPRGGRLLVAAEAPPPRPDFSLARPGLAPDSGRRVPARTAVGCRVPAGPAASRRVAWFCAAGRDRAVPAGTCRAQHRQPVPAAGPAGPRRAGGAEAAHHSLRDAPCWNPAPEAPLRQRAAAAQGVERCEEHRDGQVRRRSRPCSRPTGLVIISMIPKLK